MTNRVTAKQLVDIILGKEMSTTEIWEAVSRAPGKHDDAAGAGAQAAVDDQIAGCKNHKEGLRAEGALQADKRVRQIC